MFELRAQLDARLFCVDQTEVTRSDVITLPQVLASLPSEPLEEKVAGYNDPIFYIYTSGTTGRQTLVILSLSSSQLLLVPRSSQGSNHQTFPILVCQLLSVLHGTDVRGRHYVLGTADVSLCGPRLYRSHHHRGQHRRHQEEVLRHQVLGGLCEEQCDGEVYCLVSSELINIYVYYYHSVLSTLERLRGICTPRPSLSLRTSTRSE